MLDISGNEIDTLSRKRFPSLVAQADVYVELSCLERLRELTANDNSITSLDELKGIKSLTHLGLRGNKIASIEFVNTEWSVLQRFICLVIKPILGPRCTRWI